MKGKIAIDRELCKGCTYCIISCPKGVIAVEGNFNSKGFFPAFPKDMKRCTGCALCAEMCPEIAIAVWREQPPAKKKAQKGG
ncbi:MAG: ferredoxin family protein [Thermodesulfovibrionales bacterium]|nr:ferredoxin family protein [Thermodesulfovibrionales bacterium]